MTNIQVVCAHHNEYFLLGLMLDCGMYSFVISPKAAKAFSIPVIQRTKIHDSWDVSGRKPKTECLFTVPLAWSYGYHHCYDQGNHAFKVFKFPTEYDSLIPAWDFEKLKARGTSTSHWHFPHCPSECYGHGKTTPEYCITYDRRIAPNNVPLHFGAKDMSNPSIAQKLPTHYHKILILFAPKELEKLPNNTGCDSRIELLGPDDKLQMGPI